MSISTSLESLVPVQLVLLNNRTLAYELARQTMCSGSSLSWKLISHEWNESWIRLENFFLAVSGIKIGKTSKKSCVWGITRMWWKFEKKGTNFLNALWSERWIKWLVTSMCFFYNPLDPSLYKLQVCVLLKKNKHNSICNEKGTLITWLLSSLNLLLVFYFFVLFEV